MGDRLENMIDDIGHDSFQHAHVYDNLCSYAEKSLYPECTKYTRLSVILNLYNFEAASALLKSCPKQFIKIELHLF